MDPLIKFYTYNLWMAIQKMQKSCCRPSAFGIISLNKQLLDFYLQKGLFLQRTTTSKLAIFLS